MAYGALIVFGSGPGVGRNVAALFAERGFEKIILISRNADRLKEDADFVRKAGSGVKVVDIAVDLGNPSHVQKRLVKVDEALGDTPLDAVLYNAARLGKSIFFDFTPEDLQNDLSISVVGLYAVAQWAIPKLLEAGKMNDKKTPTFVVTSGMLAKDPAPAVFSLAACKAAQYSLVTSLHKEYEAKGVHCSLIVIGGTVAEKYEVTNPRNIAIEAFKVLEKPKEQGDLEVLMIDPDFENHTKRREK